MPLGFGDFNVVDPGAAGSLLDQLTGTATAPLPPPMPAPNLTARELEVLQLLAAGLTNRGIARRLGVSEHTAKFHIGSILSKLHAGSRAEAGGTSVATSNRNAGRSGRYRVEGLVLQISYADGGSERRILIADPKDTKGTVWIDGEGYVRRER